LALCFFDPFIQLEKGFSFLKREEGKDKEGVYEGKRLELKNLLLRGLTGAIFFCV
jgi:hypothetical protein